VNSKQQTDFDEAEKYFNLGLKLRPQKVEYYKFLGMLYDLKNDNATAIKYYSNYIKMLAPEFELAKEKKIFINMNRKDAITALGKPIDTKRFKLCEQCDSLLVDDFKVGENDVVLYSNDSKSNLTEFLVGGWRLNLSKSWTAYDKAMGFNFELSPYFNLAQSEFEKKDYDKALDNIYKVLILDPSNSEANSEVVQLLEIQGKKDDAFKYVQGLVKDNPNNPVFITQYADFLAQQEKFDEAIENYEKVLKIKPDYDIVIRNLAVAYKNKVVAIQTAQNDKLEKDPKYVPDKNEYLKYLAKSAEYYEKCRTIKKYSNDYSILADLYEIYLVLGEKEKPKAILAELKAMEPTVPKEDLVNYYKALLKIYDRMGDSQDLQEIQKKFEELSK
jgi:tetratricopeptide (TPR) repeat protein